MFRLAAPDGRVLIVGSAVEAVRLRAMGYVDVPDEPPAEQPAGEPEAPAEPAEEPVAHHRHRARPAAD